MKFKRLRVLRGNSLVIPMVEQFETVIKAEITNGSGVPIGRMNFDSVKNEFIIPATSTARMTGNTYKYNITVTKGNETVTLQYGILDIL